MTGLDPERAYVGALLHLPPAAAAQALALVDDEHLANEQLRFITAHVRQLAGAGVAPDPVLVLQVARAGGTVTTASSISGLAGLLHELYAECPVPASWRYYAAGVLDDALRRRCAEMGTRIAQAAEGESFESLLELVRREAAAVDTLANRRRVTDRPLSAAA